MNPSSSASIPVFDVVCALAFVGDLSMGQPVDHSARTAWLAARLAEASGCGPRACVDAAWAALLRWSGCTANAPEFADMMGDDVGGRRAMLALTSPTEIARIIGSVGPMARIHCEVAEGIARTLALPDAVRATLRHCFEAFDGTGQPMGLSGAAVPPTVYLVALASDLEILSRTYGLHGALQTIAERADHRYPASLVDLVREQGSDWMDALDRGAASSEALKAAFGDDRRMAALELVADVIDLKLPWMLGLSRRVAETARRCAAHLGLDGAAQGRVYRAGLIHGIGRSSVPNNVLEATRPLGEADQEKLRLVPYWAERAGRRIEALRDEALLASFIEERLDGSGHYRGVRAEGIAQEARVLATAACAVGLQTARPGAHALDETHALQRLRGEAEAGRLDAATVEALAGGPLPARAAPAASPLTEREVQVLSRIAQGESNKEAARVLGISPSTVRAHLESVFRKLECSTRAAATLKAMTLRLI
ncbi:HD-GYP domain-containing protein (c-di-GMP phosphodiesterase class II) [Pelomonas saccharophila]|uniref:HD-GYP domain-containing protein (C-di-GMP phosphodiesterase class II) n=1 Tax=Roseateles saccharophilus TaxID=304 RepID=A0ABU1YMI7_ROSSA|nr:HD domain-containing phosphohydrolase [Roseateles saccharophilus]MDR7269436.1 HD-GYP domain-containing protein (c-di-GMP phosphodiesterase class II) [Roseateles saccharophilus]